jgi:hypothetical protein
VYPRRNFEFDGKLKILIQKSYWLQADSRKIYSFKREINILLRMNHLEEIVKFRGFVIIMDDVTNEYLGFNAIALQKYLMNIASLVKKKYICS